VHAARSPEEVQKLKDDLKKTFDLLDLGEICFLLGIAVTWDCIARTIRLSQKGYIEKITKWLNLEEATLLAPPFTLMFSCQNLSPLILIMRKLG